MKYGGYDYVKKLADKGESIEIAGVDIAVGIAIAGGVFDLYKKTLSVYYEDGGRMIEQLKASLDKGDLSLYTIHIHALKSASSNIGAKSVSKFAETLEMAGQLKDFEFIKAHNNEFVTELETLLRNIHPVVKKHGRKEQNDADMGILKAELSMLKQAMDAYDTTGINVIAQRVQRFQYAGEVGDAIGKILKYKLIGEYEEASMLIEALLLNGGSIN
jgi:HPt (histidine-containing phosphotransfer) domain-containing protein